MTSSWSAVHLTGTFPANSLHNRGATLSISRCMTTYGAAAGPLLNRCATNRRARRAPVRPPCRPASRACFDVCALRRARACPRARPSRPPVDGELTWRSVRCRHGVSDCAVESAGRGGFFKKREGCYLMWWRRRRGGRRARRRSLPLSGRRHPNVSAAYRS